MKSENNINEIASTEIVENFKNLNAKEQLETLQRLYDTLSLKHKRLFIDYNIDDASARCFTY